MRTVSPVIDPIAHRAAMDALDAQRAAYRRYARALDTQRGSLNDGNPDVAAAVVNDAVRDFAELSDGATRLAPTLDRARDGASAEQLREIQQRVEDLMHEARAAETAIQNLSTQLEVWRDAYGRQLAELGIPPGGDTSDTSSADVPRPAGYGPPGTRREAVASLPRILDRSG